MQQRWTQVNQIWEDNKTAANRLSLLERIDYFGNLAAQFEWRSNRRDRPVRVLYSGAGIPTAAVLRDADALVESKLYWISCRSSQEAYYLLAIINSNILKSGVEPYMPKGQFGARDVHKHLWRLPIPEFDVGDSLHVSIADAGRQAAAGVEGELVNLRQRYERLTVTIARREVRKWLRESAEGRRVEGVVGVLLGG